MVTLLSPMPPIFALVAQGHHLGQLTVEVDALIARRLDAGTGIEPAKVHHAHLLDAQAAKVGLHAGTELLGSLSRNQALLVVVLGADLAHQHQVVGVGVQRGADQFVDDASSVELGGIDVVDTQLDSPLQHGQRRVPGGSTLMAPLGQLHGAEAHAGYSVAR
jgi:hypothetical protein